MTENLGYEQRVFQKYKRIALEILIHAIFFSQMCFFKLKQFLRTCTPIVKTYFETILAFRQKFFERFFEISHHHMYTLSYGECHGNLYHIHISTNLPPEGARKSWLHMKNRFHTGWTRLNLDENLWISHLRFIQYGMRFHVKLWFPSTLSREIPAYASTIKVPHSTINKNFMAPSPSPSHPQPVVFQKILRTF